MKKYIYYLVVAAVAALVVGVSACGKSDEPDSGKLVASWQYIAGDDLKAVLGDEWYIRLREDGTFVSVKEVRPKRQESQEDSYDEYRRDVYVALGTYSRKGDSLFGDFLNFDGTSRYSPNFFTEPVSKFVIKKLTGDKLLLNITISTNGASFPIEIELTRVPDSMVNRRIGRLGYSYRGSISKIE